MPLRARRFDLLFCVADLSPPWGATPAVVLMRNLNIYDRRWYDDARTRTLMSFSAGQGPILHYEARTGAFCVVPTNAPPFGILPNLTVEQTEPIRLDTGDLYAIISDGIFESANAAGEQFGKERVTAVLTALRRTTPSEMIAALRENVDAFTEGKPADDDRTAILIKCVG